jgi:heme O synthase-like polyprenyltransferase
MAGKIYFAGALALSLVLLYFGLRLALLKFPLTHAVSKLRARQLLQATVIYLPLLFALMMTNSAVR